MTLFISKKKFRFLILFFVVAYASSFNILCNLPPLEKSLLWEIKDGKSGASSYLYGTIHMICKDDKIFPSRMMKAFSSCKTLFLENNIENPTEREGVKEQIVGPEGYSLQAAFKPTDYQKLAKYFKDSLKTDLSRMEKFRPVAVLIVLLHNMNHCREQLNMETEFTKMAKERDMKREAFEPSTDVLAGFSPDDKNQAIEVMKMLSQVTNGKAAFDSMVRLYKQEDITALYNFSNSNGKESDVAPRNKKWIPLIETQLKKGPAFFAVGAAHLAGNEGLINSLRRKGYKVEPVKD